MVTAAFPPAGVPQPMIGSDIQDSWRIRSVTFGDGYRHLAKDGIHNKNQTIALTFQALTPIEKTTLVNFLDGLQGVDYVSYTPPGGTQGIYQITSVSYRTIGSDYWTVNCSLELRYIP